MYYTALVHEMEGLADGLEEAEDILLVENIFHDALLDPFLERRTLNQLHYKRDSLVILENLIERGHRLMLFLA
jgi:hypothetical protein